MSWMICRCKKLNSGFNLCFRSHIYDDGIVDSGITHGVFWFTALFGHVWWYCRSIWAVYERHQPSKKTRLNRHLSFGSITQLCLTRVNCRFDWYGCTRATDGGKQYTSHSTWFGIGFCGANHAWPAFSK